MTSQSIEAQRMTAEREAEQAASIQRGKQAAAQRQAEGRAQHAAELAKRKADDAAMGIPHRWPEIRKSVARANYENQQRAAQVEAERAANPSQSVSPAHGRGEPSPAGILRGLMRGSARPGMPFPRG